MVPRRMEGERMSRNLIIQSIGEDPNDWFIKWMEIAEPIHREYALRCGADYIFFAGVKEPGLHPTWNRLPMFLDAFDAGYDKIAWLDADTIVTDQETSIFDVTDNDVPLLMTRVLSSHHEFPWQETYNGAVRAADMCGMYRYGPEADDLCTMLPDHDGFHRNGGGEWERQQWDVYNDGVLIANYCPLAIEALEFAWANRRTPFKPWHVPGIPELDWILDFVYAHPEAVSELSLRFNWQNYPQAPPYDEAVVMAWHGMSLPERWDGLQKAMHHFYGVTIPDRF